MLAKRHTSLIVPAKRFDKVHDEIFENQNQISQDWLNQYAKELGVSECVKNEVTKNKVIEIIETSRKFNVASTPTMLVNGIKIEEFSSSANVHTNRRAY